MRETAEKTVEFSVNMTCGNCENGIKSALVSSGVENFQINLETQKVRITSEKHLDDLKTVLESTGKVAVLVGQGGVGVSAAVAMVGKDGDYFTPGLQGVIRFTQVDTNRCVIEGTVDGLSPGEHGLALHETGDVSRGCDSLGDHYNPRGVRHGSPESSAENRHVGDLGNIEAGANGRSTFRIVDPLVKVWDIIGRSVVISAGRDDFGEGDSPSSLVDGNCGARVACGVIARAAGLGQNTKKICQCDGVTIWDERNKPLVGPARRT